jgi:hypothetical protein
MSTTQWREKRFSDTYDETFIGLERRREKDSSFTLAEAEGILKHLYIQEGSDWVGRGELQDTVLGAAIAAHEQFITAWRKSLAEGKEGQR